MGVVALVALAVLPSCGIPRDPEGTLERVSGGTMRVGVTEHDPWVTFEDGRATGVEVELVEGFAAGLDARVRWIEGSESELMSALEFRELDVVIGGLTSTAPWATEVALTHPYYTSQVRVGTPAPGVTDITGMRVAVERGSEAAGVLAKTDAVPVEVADVSAADGAAAVDNWLLDDLGLHDTGVRLIESDHVMALPPGENAWLVALERFLLDNEARAVDLVEAHGEL